MGVGWEWRRGPERGCAEWVREDVEREARTKGWGEVESGARRVGERCLGGEGGCARTRSAGCAATRSRRGPRRETRRGAKQGTRRPRQRAVAPTQWAARSQRCSAAPLTKPACTRTCIAARPDGGKRGEARRGGGRPSVGETRWRARPNGCGNGGRKRPEEAGRAGIGRERPEEAGRGPGGGGGGQGRTLS